MKTISTNIHSLLNRTYSIVERWYFFPSILTLTALISFVVNDIHIRLYCLLIGMLLALAIKMGIRKLIGILYSAQTKGLLYTEINRRWIVSYDDEKKLFRWRVTFEQNIKNVGSLSISDLPYAEISSQHQQQNVIFEAYQLSDNNKRKKIKGKFERYTNSMYQKEGKRIKVFSIRKYLHLSEPIKPKSTSQVVIDIHYTHSKNLFNEPGLVGAYSRYPRLKDNIELEVDMPLEIASDDYEILSPLGVSDQTLYEITNKPVKQITGNRKISWTLVNPIPDYDYHILFLAKIRGA